MKTLVVGATGATGQMLTQQLLAQGHEVLTIVRTPNRLPLTIKNHGQLTLIHAGILDLSNEEIGGYVKRCDAVACCLGHNLDFKGIFGEPKKLVTEAVRKLCTAIGMTQPETPTRLVLMNTVGNQNRDLDEVISLREKIIIGLIRMFLPPHADNEQAAEYLRSEIQQDHRFIEWAVVRPDKLVDVDQVTDYEIHPSPTQSAIFDTGETSRINVGHFMSELMTNDQCWATWKGKMPVIYNK